MQRTAVITGAATGIGRATALRLAGDGFRLVLCYNGSEKAVRALSAELELLRTPHVCCKANLCERGSAAAILDCAKSSFGFADTLVNNAGISLVRLLTDCTDDEIDKVLAVNLTAAIRLTRAFVPDMVSNRFGRIVNVASVWGQTGASCEAVYSASKAGLIGFGKAMAKELAPCGITVNTVSPGVIDTAMNDDLTEAEKAELCSRIPLNRLGRADEAADAIAFLAGTEAGYITGGDIGVGGGFL